MDRKRSPGEVIFRVGTSIVLLVLAALGYKGLQNQEAIIAALNNRPTAAAGAGGEPPRLGENIPPTELTRLSESEWPTTAEAFLKAIQVPENEIPAEYKADPYYRPLQEGMITQEFDNDGNWTGGWQILLERNAGDGDRFPFVLITNSSGIMQYGYMHDPELRRLAGFTADEVALLGIGANHIGGGVPATGDTPVAVEGITFYPLVNTIDGSNNVHFLWTVLGPDMQTLDDRLARSAQSSIRSPHHQVVLGGGLPGRITSFSGLPRQVQNFQHHPGKGIRRT